MTEKAVFKPRARLLLQLGDQLIRNESIALLELVKNSYDAEASKVMVIMKNLDDTEKGIIIIEDDGIGMNLDILKNVWMEPGSDYKEKMYIEKLKTGKKRLPLGEKGIGRFAAHKLGNLIELVSRAEGHNEIYVKIDWNIFKESRYLKDVPIEIYSRKPEVFTNNRTGTKITIKKFKEPWTRATVREIYRQINSMCSPYYESGFKIDFRIDKKEWIEGLLSWEEIKDYALFNFDCEIEGQYIKKFRYEFTPWQTMKKLKKRIRTEKDDEIIKKHLKMVDQNGKPIDLGKHRIGKISFKGLVFDRDPRILSLGVQDKRGLKDYLNKNGGVRVYRDGIRIYDYGEPGNDLLSLDIRRVNIPARRISNNIIMASVFIRRSESKDLIEKTNREGFIEYEALIPFKAALIWAIHIFEILRAIDKRLIREFYGPTSNREPVVSNIGELRTIINKKISDDKLKRRASTYLDRIEAGYNEMRMIFLKSAGAGLSLSVIIHEVEKIVQELKVVVSKEKSPQRVITLVKHLSQAIEGYTLLIRKTEMKPWALNKLIEQAIFNIEFRFRVHKIELIKDIMISSEKMKIIGARNLIIGTIMNIFDNSIWWFEYGNIKNKKILVSITDELKGYNTIIMADNGPGFSAPAEEIIKPFYSTKPDGMGIGLHIAEEVMKAHEGKLLFPDWGEFKIPSEFKGGAVVALAFKAR